MSKFDAPVAAAILRCLHLNPFDRPLPSEIVDTFRIPTVHAAYKIYNTEKPLVILGASESMYAIVLIVLAGKSTLFKHLKRVKCGGFSEDGMLA